MITASGCSYTKEYKQQNYGIGVIYSTEYKEKSYISFLDDSYTVVGNKSYSYGDILPTGFSNSINTEDTLYICPLGKDTEREAGIILGIDKKSANSTEYKFNRTNITDFIHNDNYIYTSSNTNCCNYIDQYNMENSVMTSLELKGMTVQAMDCVDSKMYGFEQNMDTDELYLCQFDFSKKQDIPLYHLDVAFEESPSFLEAWNHSLYFTNGDYLYTYHIDTNEVEQLQLGHTDGFNLKVQDHILYVACTDILNGTTSYIEIYDLNANKQLGTVKCDKPILQMEVLDNQIYVSDLNTLDIYELETDFSATKIKSVDLTDTMKDGYYVAEFFLNSNQKEGINTNTSTSNSSQTESETTMTQADMEKENDKLKQEIEQMPVVEDKKAN